MSCVGDTLYVFPSIKFVCSKATKYCYDNNTVDTEKLITPSWTFAATGSVRVSDSPSPAQTTLLNPLQLAFQQALKPDCIRESANTGCWAPPADFLIK